MRRAGRAMAVVAAGLLPALAAVVAATDLAVPTRRTGRIRRVVAVFPHADDETVSCGGTLHRLAREGARVVLVLLTSGERGTPDGRQDPELGAVRAGEARAAGRHLGVARVVQAGFADGELARHAAEASAVLAAVVARERPQLVLTHDPTGVYGHPDHVACSTLVTDLRERGRPDWALWHTALPRPAVPLMRWSGQLVTSPELERSRVAPTHRIFVGRDVLAKRSAWAAYRSQRRGLAGGLAGRLPLLLLVALQPFEHFTDIAPPARTRC
ncbi:MAG TPA: PIG-L family deacetylase [Verrucomicrobiae bacterium]|nr:PIG-L family deacetylase [Verrucomicrobiae bacterium]